MLNVIFISSFVTLMIVYVIILVALSRVIKQMLYQPIISTKGKWKYGDYRPAIAKSDYTVFICPGNTGCAAKTPIDRTLNILHSELYILDYPNYGNTDGKENMDIESFYKRADEGYLDMLGKTNKPVIIIGRSLGTGIACYLADKYSPFMLILMTPYYNMTKILNDMFPLLGYSTNLKFNCIKFLKNFKQKNKNVVIIAGFRDKVTPYKHAERLARETQTLLLSYDGGHMDVEEKINEWLDKFQRFYDSATVANTGSAAVAPVYPTAVAAVYPTAVVAVGTTSTSTLAAVAAVSS